MRRVPMILNRRTFRLALLAALATPILAHAAHGLAYWARAAWTTGPLDMTLDFCAGVSLPEGLSAETVRDDALTVLREGEDCAWRFELASDDPPLKGGPRAEVRTWSPPHGAAHDYCFRTRLAEAPHEAAPATIAQWHGVPDRLIGERGRPPPLRLLLHRGEWIVAAAYDRRPLTGAPLLGGPPENGFEVYRRPASLDQWTDWCFRVDWRRGGEGFVALTVNGEEVARHEGPLGYADVFAPFFKAGVYVPSADPGADQRWRLDMSALSIKPVGAAG